MILSTSTSSSSASSIGSDVYVPWPISICGETNVTFPARSMRRKAFGANGASVVSVSRTSPRAGRPKPSSKPPPRAVVAVRKLRREDDARAGLFISRVLIGDAGGALDCGADARIGAAAADVAQHGRVDV